MDSSDSLSWLLERARACGADAADAVLFETVEMSASWRLGKPEGLERSESMAVGLRAFSGERQAIVSSTVLTRDSLSELAERAVAMARLAPPDPDSVLAPEGLRCTQPADLDLADAEEPNADWLREACREAEDAALSVSGITNSEGADAGYSRTRVSLAILSGAPFARSYQTSNFMLSASVVAGEGVGMERDYDYTSARHRRSLASPASVGHSAAQRAIKRLNPRRPATSQLPVVFDPRIGRGLLSVLAGCISGSSVARGATFLKDKLHQPLFAPGIQVVDDPTIIGGLGSRPFDAEGVAGKKRLLVENGVLTSWLLDMRSASKLGMQTTGHASRGIAGPPSPSATNLYLDKGELTPGELMADIKEGLYITETFGHGVNTVTGDYSQGAAGFWIENGQLAYPVSEFTIAGHLFPMFAGLRAADDLVLRYATNAPTLRVDSMTVAGA